MTIILYDLSSTLPEKAWNFNVWKARLSLNLKGLPYTTEWVEYPEIEPLFKKLGIPPSKNKPDGSPFYTVPAIHDSSTGVYISDSILIAQYLDKTYPNKPLIIPDGTIGLQSAFHDAVFHNIKSVLAVVFPSLITKLNPTSAKYMLSSSLSSRDQGQINISENWKAFEEGLSQIDSWYSRNGGKGSFLLGEVVSWADIVLASFLTSIRRILGEESKEWKEIVSWNGGRWKDLSNIFRVYETVA